MVWWLFACAQSDDVEDDGVGGFEEPDRTPIGWRMHGMEPTVVSACDPVPFDVVGDVDPRWAGVELQARWRFDAFPWDDLGPVVPDDDGVVGLTVPGASPPICGSGICDEHILAVGLSHGAVDEADAVELVVTSAEAPTLVSIEDVDVTTVVLTDPWAAAGAPLEVLLAACESDVHDVCVELTTTMMADASTETITVEAPTLLDGDHRFAHVLGHPCAQDFWIPLGF